MKSNVDLTSDRIFVDYEGIPLVDFLGSVGTPYAKFENGRYNDYNKNEIFKTGYVRVIKIKKEHDKYLDNCNCERCGKRIMAYEYQAMNNMFLYDQILCIKCDHELRSGDYKKPYWDYNKPSNVKYDPMQSFL